MVKQSKTPKEGKDRLSRNVGNKTTNLRRVTSQKGAGLHNTAAEA